MRNFSPSERSIARASKGRLLTSQIRAREDEGKEPAKSERTCLMGNHGTSCSARYLMITDDIMRNCRSSERGFGRSSKGRLFTSSIQARKDEGKKRENMFARKAFVHLAQHVS
ncbi:hypothetical protein TNCV_4409081 [Trichonephila clavipes]|nr:hypothetical protein TNCV_4409081 [Trichonephila clavipes]